MDFNPVNGILWTTKDSDQLIVEQDGDIDIRTSVCIKQVGEMDAFIVHYDTLTADNSLMMQTFI